MCLNVQETRRSDTTFNEKRNITKSSFKRNMKIAAGNIYLPNPFELLNTYLSRNRFPENQHTFQKKCTVPGEKTYKEAVIEKTNTAHTNLGDSIISFNRGIKSAFNKTLKSGRARFKHFLGASSKDLFHYIDLTLEEQNFEAAIIHIGVNHILYDSNSR